MSDLVGHVLGNSRCHIEEFIGRVGQSAVFKYTHLSLDAPMAIKVLGGL